MLQLEGSFVKKDIPYSFWAFFPDGTLNGESCLNLESFLCQDSIIRYMKL